MRFSCVTAIALIVVSCRGGPSDETRSPTLEKTHPPTSPVGPTGWRRGAGAALVVPVPGSPVDVMIVLPDVSDETGSDTTSFNLDLVPDRRVDLFGPGSRPETGVIVPDESSSRDCGLWPTARLQRIPARPWRAAFAEGMVLGATLDSLSPEAADAQRLVGHASRVAGGGPFSGIPFTVRSIYRASFGDHRVFTAELFRRINSEADAREQRVFMVTEQAAPHGRERVVHHEVSTGGENAVTVADLLTAVWVDEQPALVVAYESERGIRFGIIAGDSSGSWKVAWRSARTSCS